MSGSLQDKISDVLARLSMLSEAPGSAPLSRLAPPEDLPKDTRPEADRGGRASPKRHHESSIPAGVSTRQRDPDRPPPKERSLFDFYAWQFERIDLETEPHRALTFYLLAERDYMTRCFHIPDRMALRSGSLTENDAIDGGKAEEAAADRVIELYTGVPAIEVAINEYTTEDWVKKVRRMRGREPEDGRPRAEFLDWDDDERRRQIRTLQNRRSNGTNTIGAKAIADYFGVSKQTIQRYLEPQAVAA